VKDERLKGNKECGQRELREEKVMTFILAGKLRIRSEIKASLTSKMEAARSSETSTRNKNP
jgi:hypothetical protein